MEYVLKYIQQNIRVFACNANKTPATRRGFYDATTDINILKQQFTDENMLIGMPTGNGNNIVVIDLDIGKPLEDEHGKKILDNEGNEIIDPRTVEEIFEEFKEIGPVPETFQTETPSGGRHLWFSVPYTKLPSARRFFDKTLPVDIRANGGYVIVPDGISNYMVYDDVDGLDIDDIRSRCAPLPDWITNFKPALIQDETLNNILPPDEIKEIRSALAFLSSDDRDTWIRIGMALKSTGSITAKGLWDEWSQKSDKYNPKDQEKRWKTLKPNEISVATIFHEAKKLGWHTTYDKSSSLCIENIEDESGSPEIIVKKYSREPFPKKLLRPPGLVGEIVDYINHKSIKEQPILALGAALAAVGALEGRKIQTEMGVRTNIYCLGVGASGSGKEAARKAIKELFQWADCGEYASVEEIASDASITTALSAYPSQIFLLDEIGRFLKTTTSASKSPHLYNVISSFLKLYSSSSSMYYGKIYADKDKQVKIDNPNLCIYGTTVPDTLYKGLVLENIVDGFLSRMLIFESEEVDPPKKARRNLTKRPDDTLVEKIRLLKNKKTVHDPEGNIDTIMNVRPYTVDMSDEAQDILERFDDYIRKHREKLREEGRTDLIYNRTSQIAEQIALIIAGGIDIEYPVITDKEITYGIELTKYLADNMLYIAENFIADSEYHHAVKDVLQLIRSNGRMTMTQITRKTQGIQTRVRIDILETLKQSEQIQEYSEGSGNTKKKVFVAV